MLSGLTNTELEGILKWFRSCLHRGPLLPSDIVLLRNLEAELARRGMECPDWLSELLESALLEVSPRREVHAPSLV